MPEPALTAARQYLLGTASEEQRAAIEHAYFEADEARSALEAEEERLIEEYLADDLSGADRRQFEHHYLASPIHRRRVAVVRSLSRPSSGGHAYRWLAAAAVLFLTIGGVWMFAPRLEPGAPAAPVATVPETPRPAPSPTSPAAVAPTVFAFALSPITVRGDAASQPLVIPSSTEIVRLELQREGDAPAITEAAATIRTVEGREVWSGAATIAGVGPGLLARVDVPATALKPDDYIVEIAGYRYFLRVRA
jgi:hypothetical protein